MPPTRTTTIVAKRPRAGLVKTRLCPPLSPEQAAALAEAMLDDTVAACLALDAHETSLCFAPAEDEGWFRARYPRVAELRAQRGADLGARLAADLALVLARSPRGSAVWIGCDSPHAPFEAVIEAHEALERGTDLVLGASEDGGYWLIGLRGDHPEIFTSVAMSAADTRVRTIALARERGLALHEVARTQDVDQGADLALLARRFDRDAGLRERAPRSAACVAGLRGLLAGRGPGWRPDLAAPSS